MAKRSRIKRRAKRIKKPQIKRGHFSRRKSLKVKKPRNFKPKNIKHNKKHKTKKREVKKTLKRHIKIRRPVRKPKIKNIEKKKIIKNNPEKIPQKKGKIIKILHPKNILEEDSLTSSTDITDVQNEIKGSQIFEETNVDKLYHLIEEKGSVPITQASKKLGVKETVIEEWANILEEHNLMKIYYPKFGKVILFSLKKKGKNKEEKINKKTKRKVKRKPKIFLLIVIIGVIVIALFYLYPMIQITNPIQIYFVLIIILLVLVFAVFMKKRKQYLIKKQKKKKGVKKHGL